MGELTGKSIGLTTVKGRLLTVAETAQFLRVSPRWVEQKMRDGLFPFRWFPIGLRDHAVDSADLDRWLLSIRVEAGMAPLPSIRRAKLKQGRKGAVMK